MKAYRMNGANPFDAKDNTSPIITHAAGEQSEALVCHVTCPDDENATLIAQALVN